MACLRIHLVLAGTALLLGSVLPLPAHADCEGGSTRSFDYGMSNSWRGKQGIVAAKLETACAAHQICYETHGSRRRSCDKVLKADLFEVCDKTFRVQPKRLKGCKRHVAKGMKQVAAKGPVAFVQAQSRARRLKSSTARSTRSSARKQSSAERRAARRRAAYKQIYEQVLGTGSGTGTGSN